jgi:hypothetical protein
MYSERGDPKRAGFPHSEICGSAPICRLPAAYRRLSRPSSPIIAKASTTCTYSLDPITLLPHAFRAQSTPGQSPLELHKEIGNSHACACIPIRSREQGHDAIHNPVSPRAQACQYRRHLSHKNNFTFYPKLLKISRSALPEEAPINLAMPHAGLIADSSMLIVERLGWWVWMDSNHRPPPYQDGALTN